MIIQVLPSIAPHDAISQHVLRLDSALRERNIDTAILAHHVHPSFRDRVAHEEDFVNFDGLHILYHMSIASSLAEKFIPAMLAWTCGITTSLPPNHFNRGNLLLLLNFVLRVTNSLKWYFVLIDPLLHRAFRKQNSKPMVQGTHR